MEQQKQNQGKGRAHLDELKRNAPKQAPSKSVIKPGQHKGGKK